MKRLIYLLCVIVCLVGCKSGKHLNAPSKPVAQEVPAAGSLVSKLRLTIPGKNGTMTVGGLLKMQQKQCVQISILMPFLRTEMIRLEVTPAEMLIVDRMNKRYVRASRDELKAYLPQNATFAQLEKLLVQASKPEGKKSLSGRELGIPSLEAAKVELYDFVSRSESVTPTVLGDKYVQVPMEELVKILLPLVSSL